ncbi:MAG TPA: baseplate J/gp47 family protein, partial [Polyangiales bacterium]|nr:baseplate J/gp47 family protein [Polyangiales bacterium]
MGYARPSLRTLLARVIGDVSSRTEGSAYVDDAPERFLAISTAGVAHGLHGHLEWNAKQLLPTTADEAGLADWGNMLEVERNPATKATGPATFTGTNGTVLPVGTSLKAPDDSLYTVKVGATVASSSVVVTVEANVAGAAGNLDNGAQ